MLSTKWNKIVDLYNKYKFKSEEEIQRLWEQLFADAELFGYSKICDEIEAHRTIQIGSCNRVIPDIIIKKDDKELFIVELKQFSLDCGDKQLLSYLKLLQQVKIGILIFLTLVPTIDQISHRIKITRKIYRTFQIFLTFQT